MISFQIKPWVAFGQERIDHSLLIWVRPIPVDRVILHWYACGADGWSLALARSVYGHVITKFSRMGRLPHFPNYEAPPTHGASRRPWSSAIILLSINSRKTFMKVLKTSRFAIVRNHYCSQKYEPGKNLYEVDRELGAGELPSSTCVGVGNRPLGKKQIANPRGMPGGAY